MNETEVWLEQAIRMARENAANGDGPFAAIVVRNGEIVGTGVNRVGSEHDPTAHAELLAIREACTRLGRTDLSDCTLYASGEPCPMCMGAIYWAKPGAVYYACSKAEAADAAGFPDPLGSFYAEMSGPAEKRTIAVRRHDAQGKLEPFFVWASR
ncbi:nucleoside deaminase [Paenibacillus mesophilus]|uniref:nucleoside deaminase n=1 Tax=Paenibacillus mesophilus TaxID=2582849 RepID=UPI00110E5286|nr:nucleoside deaminase [Paenibacillus mesophilus]TMV44454.1 nucleoside deaminase [Paenibacillus mesophilus]